MTTDNPNRDDIDDAIDWATNERWELKDYEYREGEYDTPELTIVLEYVPPTILEQQLDDEELSVITALQNTLRELQGGTPYGAHYNDVITELETEHDIDPETTKETIQLLRNRGEIYEPQTDHLRVV